VITKHVILVIVDFVVGYSSNAISSKCLFVEMATLMVWRRDFPLLPTQEVSMILASCFKYLCIAAKSNKNVQKIFVNTSRSCTIIDLVK